MKTATAILVLTMAAASGLAHADKQADNPADNPAEAHEPLRPVSDCMRPDRINAWYVVDTRTTVVSNGPNYYLIKLESECPRLGIGRSLLFKANESNRIAGLGAICGETGETVQSLPHQPPCAIQSVSKIDKDQFDQMEKQAIQRGYGNHRPKATAKP
ncbi:DUF6491 family protein [Dyella subtropica]|uniref:DUF6491 family protein n=1 Tax=Dyella subtropica TaxID=2992127 RepID=UPI002254B147|nr:DUF6491 family protein [Dyella subtropica]